jgi:hypothetical protein
VNKKLAVKRCSHEPNKEHDARNSQRLHHRIERLVAIATSTPVHKPIDIVTPGKALILWHRLAQELTQWIPTIGHAELEQVVLVDQTPHFGVMLDISLLSGRRECAVEKRIEEFLQHGVVQCCAPAEVRQDPEFRIRYAPPDRLHGRTVPGLNVAVRENYFCFGVGLDQFSRESRGGPVTYSLMEIGLARCLY